MDREVIFIIDTSGSMGGVSIRQARQALQYALERLKPGDFFNIIQFNSHTSQLFPYAVPASRQKLRIAKNYVLNLDAGGGTEMAPALHAALMNQTDSERVRQVIFLTDGSVGNENMLFEIIQQQLDQSRLFTIGIGSAPNSHFMARAAEYGRGTHTYIGNIDEVQEQMMHLFSKLERPVLSSIRLTGAEAYSHEMWPQLIPDLYAGEPLIVTIKAQKLMDNITVSGQLANQTWQSDITLSGGQSQDGIHGLWARKKIASLMSQQTRANESGSVRDLIVETALEHHLVSKYTSLVAVDKTPARSQAEKLKSAAMPTNLPAGWQYDKVFGQMPATATPAALHLLLGSLLVMTGWASRFIRLRLLKGKSM
jgi:Ca-activated chloride channel family protein